MGNGAKLAPFFCEVQRELPNKILLLFPRSHSMATRRGPKNSNEAKPLLEVTQKSSTQYDSTPTQPGRKGIKLRAMARQTMALASKNLAHNIRRKPEANGIFKSVFSSRHSRATVRMDGSAHSALYNYLNPKSHSSSALCFQKFITLVIVVDVFFYIVSTEPRFAGLPLFYYAEGITSTVFLVEYLSRLLVCTEQVSILLKAEN
jgi:hypothetical protein